MSSKLLDHRAALSNIVRRVAVDAGELILEYFDGIKDMCTKSKGDGSIVTLADQEAERLIENRLVDILPNVPVIGEESYANGKRVDLSNHDYFWLVDPLDGTRAFVAGEGDFTVNIGLIHRYEPVLGVIYAPEIGELYFGFTDVNGNSQSMRYFEDSDNEKQMRTRCIPKKGLTVMSSGYRSKVDAQEEMLEQLKVSSVIRRASSVKICEIANGKADLYPRFGATCEWDTAAGHAILRAAGGDIRDLKGNSLKYGMGKDFLNPYFIAASGDVLKYLEILQS